MSIIQLRGALTRSEMDMMMCHIVRLRPVMQAAHGQLKHDQFLPDSELVYRLIWVVVREFWDAHRQCITKPVLMASLDKKKEDHPEYFAGNIYDTIKETVELIYSFNEGDLIDVYGIDLLKKFLSERKIGAQLIDAAQKGAMEQRHVWNMFATMQQIDALTPMQTVFPFSTSTGPLLGIKPREPTGVTFLDLLMGGGPRKGELYGFLAPSAGGKTTLANQIAINYTLSGKHLMFFTYEQPPDNEYMVPVYACAAQASRKKFEKIMQWSGNLDFLEPAERERFERVGKIINERLHYKDMTSGARTGVDEIKTLVEREQNDIGAKIDAVIIDWFLPMAARSYDRLDLGYGKKKDLRTYMQDQIDRLKVVMVELDVWGWLTHQLNLTTGAKRNKLIGFEDAAELKSFAWYLNGCFCLTKMDDDYMAPLNFSKARGQKSDKTVIKLLGEIATFVDAGDMVFDQRQKKYVERGKENVIPRAGAEDVVKSADRRDYEGEVGAVHT